MARFPIQRAPEKLGIVPTTAVRANIDVDTGGQLVAEAIADMGAAIADMGVKLYAKDAKVKADDAEVTARLSMVQFLKEIRNVDDVNKWDKLFEQHGQRVISARPKHKGAASRYDSVVKNMIPGWQEIFMLQREGKLEDNMLAASIKKVDLLRNSASFGNMDVTTKKIRAELLLRDKLSFSISRTDTELLLADVSRDVQTSAAEKLALTNPNDLLTRIEGSKIQGFDKITEATEVMRLGGMARRTIGLALAQQKELREQETNTEQGRLMRLAREGKLTDGVIRDSILDEFGTGSKNTFYGILDSLADAALKGKEKPYKESDSVVEARILERIRDPRSDITPKDISDLVGKGLSIDDADRMITRLDIFKSSWFGRADRFLKDNLGWSDTLAKYTFPEGALSYKLAMDELFDAIETEKLKGRDILNRAAEISVPYIIEYHQNVLLTSPERIERIRKLLGGKAGVEPKSKPSKTETENSLDEIWK